MSFNIKHKSLWTVICLSLFLSGCATKRTLSDQELVEYRAKIEPFMQYWQKPDMQKEVWLEDWMECGGEFTYPGNDYWIRPATTKVFRVERRRKIEMLDDCMYAKGYKRYNPLSPKNLKKESLKK